MPLFHSSTKMIQDGAENPPGQAGDVAERKFFFGQKMGKVMGKQHVIM